MLCLIVNVLLNFWKVHVPISLNMQADTLVIFYPHKWQLTFILFCLTASFSQWFLQNQATAHVALMLSHHIGGVCVTKTVRQTTNAVSLTVELSVSLLLSVRVTMFNLFFNGQLLEHGRPVQGQQMSLFKTRHTSQAVLEFFVYLDSPLAKPGVCPRRTRGFGVCAEYCSNDSDCPSDEKCCFNGCGHQCTKPFTGDAFKLYNTHSVVQFVTECVFAVCQWSWDDVLYPRPPLCVQSTAIMMANVQESKSAAEQPAVMPAVSPADWTICNQATSHNTVCNYWVSSTQIIKRIVNWSLFNHCFILCRDIYIFCLLPLYVYLISSHI